MYVSGHQRDWDTFIPFVLFAYRTSLHESIQETPFFLMHGRDPVLPVEAAMCPPTITYTSSDDYKSEMVTRLQEAFTLAKDNLQAAQRKQKEQYDLKSDVINYAIGDKIWVFNPSTKPGLSTKLLHNWHGLYVIIDKLSDVNYKLQMCDSKKSEQTVHVNRIKQFVDPDDRPIIDGEDIVPNINPIENSDNTKVKILDTMRSRNESKRLEKHYFVQYENGETQWVKEDAIKDFAIINDFHISNENID
ncbi:unnamed protein product [Mytilus coruscus]|uniref:Integrase p58-like C-terminal domain-containing protein n=1 Tax=Mytilus coruscus TaxID=42192 RepID=A0A6J8ASJ0_MYTCO|nr:unnamed protein product [Mytilus coruscus]